MEIKNWSVASSGERVARRRLSAPRPLNQQLSARTKPCRAASDRERERDKEGGLRQTRAQAPHITHQIMNKQNGCTSHIGFQGFFCGCRTPTGTGSKQQNLTHSTFRYHASLTTHPLFARLSDLPTRHGARCLQNRTLAGPFRQEQREGGEGGAVVRVFGRRR